ncbi:MAG: hypothetical protein JRG90_22250 [Deltaproteobacteria bacterium]|nr:hypothetical protein [Deltaproteobacteria bacterium]
MSAAASVRIETTTIHEPLSLTLLELVEAVNDFTSNDDEVVATVRHMLQTGRIRLCGNFRGVSASVFD